MLIDTFHPDVVQSQTADVRLSQLVVYSDLARWMQAHYNELINVVGKNKLDEYLEKMVNIHNLAQIGARFLRR